MKTDASRLSPNPVLAQLGYPPDARLVIFHADDVGMCHGSNRAFIDLQAAGVVQCGSIMAPCPWAPEILDYCAAHPEIDVGVHLTLNSEWPGYRWGPVSTRAVESGLIDARGHFWPQVAQMQATMRASAALAELRAQIELVRAAGIDFTHLDTHMGAALTPALFPAYVELGFEYNVPVLVLRQLDDYVRALGFTQASDAEWSAFVAELEARGMPLIDHFRVTPGYGPGEDEGGRADLYAATLRALPPGITYFSLHPNASGDIEIIAPERAHWRTFEHDYFRSPQLLALLQREQIQPIGYRALCTLMRTARRNRRQL
ncbi:MAG TPA: hypothetical protein DCL15_03560 [Chloroflexi bacterium]|nr:hypothetical protein [Chloroflexota bacterium]HHW87135.1 ChbG/HpnK family deacetylase [Chloroflexota bacterium]